MNAIIFGDHMKKIIISAAAGAFILIANPTAHAQTTAATEPLILAGTINGGGGKGVLCKNGQASTLEVLDLYEAKALYDLKIEHNPQTKEEAINLFAELIGRHLWNPSTVPLPEFIQMLKGDLDNAILKKIKFLTDGKHLALVDDADEPIYEANCEMKQIAVYYDESVVLVDQSLWDQMNWTNRIALLTHEMFYSMDRSNGATNSMATRKLVGQLFSTTGAVPKADGIPTDLNKVVTCLVTNQGIDVGYFYAFDSIKQIYGTEPSHGLEFVFNFLKNGTYLFRTSAFFADLKLDALSDSNRNGVNSTDLIIDSYQPKQSLGILFTEHAKSQLFISEKANGSITEKLQLSCNKNKL